MEWRSAKRRDRGPWGPDATSLVRGLTACMREGPTSTTPWHGGWKLDDGGQRRKGLGSGSAVGAVEHMAWRLGRHTGVTAVKTKERGRDHKSDDRLGKYERTKQRTMEMACTGV